MPRMIYAAAAALLFLWPAAGPATADDVDATGGLAITIPLGEDAAPPAVEMQGSAEGGWEATEQPLDEPATIGDPELATEEALPSVADTQVPEAEQEAVAAAVEAAKAPDVVRRAVGDPPQSEGLVYLPPELEAAPGAAPLPPTVVP